LNTFTLYKSHALTSNNRRRTDYYALSERHRALIPDYLTRLNKVDHAISKNYHVLKQILSDGKLFVGEEYKVCNDFFVKGSIIRFKLISLNFKG
jgi:hypothetical protein